MKRIEFEFDYLNANGNVRRLYRKFHNSAEAAVFAQDLVKGDANILRVEVYAPIWKNNHRERRFYGFVNKEM